ncbi:hypothetical protein [Alloyangia pacifica]|uniref:Asl1-like glycosyl hydrolase catalytic domain-containing protein n=1 Tax=Alloyangia pacifica TaxID=311180 RepID=A0A1I6T453_9RHOB|nr:hypothetical protein [Alloyangia pacifica]SDG96530.1 hypothetical protein SAMN04488245_105274 [Alloyangia pacifica]SFS83840.1 hypothetical protein SAMN04488050_105274 [Alloyangia pacifica]
MSTVRAFLSRFQSLAPAALVALAAAQSGIAQADEGQAVGPRLGAASNFSQGRQPGTMELAEKLGVATYRDGMVWDRVESAPGRFVFDDPRTAFAREIAAQGATASLVLNWGNKLYDGGDTPHSAEALAAFGTFAAEVVTQFPEVDSLEIGNEFNGTNFVRGPLKKMPALERARAYVDMLAAASSEARAARPGIRISGGATHSIPVGYLWEVLDAGGAAYIDALAIHPYTTDAEQFVRQIEVLRRHPDAAELPLEVTEFGEPDPSKAASHFLRNYCQFALGGVTHAIWYPLNARGDDMVPLFTKQGQITPAGRAFRLIRENMEGRPVADASQGPFSYGCTFGDAVMVVWGAPRSIEVSEGVSAHDAAGSEVAGPLALSEDEPLVFIAEGGGISNKVKFGSTAVIADSNDQFAYPEDTEFQAGADAFERFARRGGKEFPLITLPGQEAKGTPWYPYRGNPDFGNIRLSADGMLPGGRADSPVEIVHRYTAPEDEVIDVASRFAAAKRSEDGVSVRITLNERELFAETGKQPIKAELSRVTLRKGDQLEVSVGPNGTRKGDLTTYSIRLSRS